MQNPELVQILMHLYSSTLPKLVAGGSGRPAVTASDHQQEKPNNAISDLYHRGIPFRIGELLNSGATQQSSACRQQEHFCVCLVFGIETRTLRT
jgi:hypothetical protein